MSNPFRYLKYHREEKAVSYTHLDVYKRQAWMAAMTRLVVAASPKATQT